MRSVEDIRQTLAMRKAELARRFHVKNLAVFGSYARDEQKAGSDIDLLVEFDAPVGVEFIDLANFLEDLLHARRDLVSRHGIKPKYFRTIENDLNYVYSLTQTSHRRHSRSSTEDSAIYEWNYI